MRTGGGKDTSNCVVRGIGFDDEGHIRLIMGKDGPMGAVMKATLRALKECRHSSEKFQEVSFWVSRVRGTMMSE